MPDLKFPVVFMKPGDGAATTATLTFSIGTAHLNVTTIIGVIYL